MNQAAWTKSLLEQPEGWLAPGLLELLVLIRDEDAAESEALLKAGLEWHFT